ncbi:histidine decarboxylase [Chitinophaga sp. Cy-1792]|uniref:histidine decarboxylase n=1 Tax=Chitinophaga sp. Cy-1792 TaxID=2608339 RepID=UPI001421EA23|nr:histidine decarboxylase [Chitinophaga sp. Cy-1792]NIG57539.1 histidine decarboxylase [Chitinophaga sp. Cy-1792]
MEKFENYLKTIQERSKHFIGYPAGIDFEYSELYPLLEYNLNNIGDPFVDSHCDMHSREFERDVLAFFASLFKAPRDNWWGYVGSGGTEGNLYSLYLARELYPKGIVYYSESTHYSIQKNIHLLGMSSIVIRSKENGEMDYDDLAETVKLNRHQPTIIVANIGTTMTEAKDDVGRIKEILKSYAITQHYIHCDAALAGTYLALLDKCRFDFAAGADSISVSGHKFIGSPIPCGVVIVKKNYKDRIGRSIPYIGNLDTTITGSRSAVTPVFLWYIINKIGREGLLKRATDAMDVAAYALEQLQAAGIDSWRNPHALTVVFRTPSPKICYKWQLATQGDWSHLICMPGITKAIIDEFIADLINPQFQEQAQNEFAMYQ